MKIREFFTLAIQAGIDADPRGRTNVEWELCEARKEYEKLKAEDKATFDQEKLENPYADSRILHGDPDREVTGFLADIDVETPELLLADRLIHTRPVDAARLLDIPYLCLHTPADNMVSGFLQALFEQKSPSRLKDVIKLLKEIPEYQQAARNNAGPRILVGSDDQRPGRVFVDMTGGTSGSKDTLEKLSHSGVGTIVGMHMSEDHRKEAEKHHIHVVIAGHISSDTLGMNLLLDAVEKQCPLTVFACSGFKRITRLS